MEPIYDGWMPTQVQPATKEQLVALRDLLLSHGDKSAAAAVDNVIDILSRVANRTDAVIPTAEKVEVRSNPALQADVRHEARQMAHTLTDRNPTAAEIALDNGKLRPYVSNLRHAVADNHEFHSYTWDGE
jgi:hypothetical protein